VAVLTKVDHVEAGLSRLITLWKDKPNVVGLLKSYLEQFNELEDLLFSILQDRSLYTAAGVQLDMIGALFGVTRQGRDDIRYRPAIVSAIARLNDDGTTEKFLNLLRLVGNTDLVDFWEHPNGDVHAYLGEGIFSDIYSTVKSGTAAGIKLRIVVDEYGDSLIPAELISTSSDLQTHNLEDIQTNEFKDLQVNIFVADTSSKGVMAEIEDTILINPLADLIFSDWQSTDHFLLLEEGGYLLSEEYDDKLIFTTYEFD